MSDPDAKQKVYRVTVTLEIYGQDSPTEVTDFLEEVLDIDGVALDGIGRPRLKPSED